MNALTLIELVRATTVSFLRSRAMALTVIIGPLLVVLLAGYALDTAQLPGVSVGVYTPEANKLADSFIATLAQNEFKVTRFSDKKDCIDAIKQGAVHTCLTFPTGFSLKESNEITFYIDYSKLSLVWTLMNVMTSRTQEQSIALTQNLTGQVLNALDVTEQALEQNLPLLVRLATENDDMTRRADEIEAELAELDLSFNGSKFRLDDLKRGKTQVGQWVDTALSNGQEALHEAERFVGIAKDTAPSEEVSDALAKTMKDIASLKERMDTTRNLAEQEFSELSQLIDNIVNRLDDTEQQLDMAEGARGTSVDNIRSVQRSLQFSLLHMFNVQRSFNAIQVAMASIEIRDPGSIAQPIITTIKPVVARRSPLNYALPTLLTLVIALTALFIAPTLVHAERKSSAALRIRATLSPVMSVVSTGLTVLVIITVQALLALFIALLFGAHVWTGLVWSIITIIGISIVSIAIGLIIGYAVEREDLATLIAISVGLAMIVLSDLLVPLEAMPGFLRFIAGINPILWGSDLLRQAMFGVGFVRILPGLLKLLLYSAATIAIMVWVWSRQEGLKVVRWIKRG